MRELGLFPLPAVLLPGEMMPLHIFEPRYRELLEECMEQERPFGLLFQEEEPSRIGTEAIVARLVERMADGRFTVLVEGGARFEVLELTEGRSFDTGSVTAYDDEDPDGDAGLLSKAVARLRKLAELTETPLESLELDDATSAFSLAAHVELEAEAKQKLLELRSENARLELLSELLEQAAESIARARALHERASGNGKVGDF